MKSHNIGLNRNIVKLQSHDTTWQELFNETKKDLANLLSNYSIEIEHVGSTSINGIDAKPIIDIAIGMSDINLINQIIPILENNQYIYRGDSGENGGHLFVKESAEEVRTHHIHIIDLKDVQWKNYLYFRDKLKKDSTLKSNYQNLKRTLSEKYKHDRKSYTKGKNDFIKSILEK